MPWAQKRIYTARNDLPLRIEPWPITHKSNSLARGQSSTAKYMMYVVILAYALASHLGDQSKFAISFANRQNSASWRSYFSPEHVLLFER